MNHPLARSDCSDCPVRHSAICARCDARELALLEAIKYYRSFEAGQTIAWAGDELGFVAAVVCGVAKLSQTLEDGRTQMLGLLLPSDFIGRPGRLRNTYDLTAVSDITLCCFRRKPFEALLANTPHISERLLTMTLDELDAAREWILILGRKTAREKIASLLSIIARRVATIGLARIEGPVVVDLLLNHEAMVEYLGLTLETVSRQMTTLKGDNIIVLDGKRRVKVHDIRRLLQETGDNVDGGMVA